MRRMLLAGICLTVSLFGFAKTPGDPSLGDYRKWHKVNPTPVRMGDQLVVLCAAPPPARTASIHAAKYITVYTNEIGRKAMSDPKMATAFPTGSIIVKEKLPSIDSRKAELLTVMVKREKGFAPDDGDWQYFVADPTGKITARGKDVEACAKCHRDAAKTQFVFRTYSFGFERLR